MVCGEKKGGCEAAGGQAPDEKLKMFTEDGALVRCLSRIKHKILVLSGKGGVGKSTVAVNLAVALAMEGRETGLLDVDFHGPSVPMLLNLKGQLFKATDGGGIMPVESPYGLKVVSLGFALKNADEAVIWRGPMKMGVIKQLLTDVQWGDLDYLVVDFPPGTGDEPLSVAQLIPESDGAVIVTTPQGISLQDVRKSINFCRQLKIPVLGVIENMSGLMCPHCGKMIEVFKSGGGEAMAKEMGVSLGKVNYCLQALVQKGLVKMGNFRRNNKKLAYSYLLTPHGIEEKARLTVHFLKYKIAEYEAIRQEIKELRREAEKESIA